MSHEPAAAALPSQLLARVARRVGGSLALDDTLEAIAAAVVEALGFRAAVVNLLDAAGELHVVAVAGSDEVKAGLSGTHSPLIAWQALLDAATPWGELRFLSHGSTLPVGAEDMTFYVPELPVPGAETTGRWHPQDALFAPLRSRTGVLLGVLSVDDPVDGMLPDADGQALLEAFAVHAALAIEHAHEHAAIRDSELLLRRTFEESPVAKALFGPDGRYERVNRAYCEFLGRSADEFLGRQVFDFTHPDERESAIALSHQIRQGEIDVVAKLERRYLHADGSERWGRLGLTRLGEGAEARVLASIEDVTESRAAEAQLRHHALHDSLTGLPNRSLIFDRLEQALARARRDGTPMAVIVVDIDHFKLVNDSYGHPAGDQLLVRVAHELRTAMRDSDTAGRLGGDEFVVLCEGVSGPADVVAIAERLRTAVRIPVQVGDVTVIPSASLGGTVSAPDATTEQLIAEADTALYRAKAAGRGCFELFDDEMRQCSVTELQLRAELQRALPDGEFRLHYQAIVDLTTGAPLGYEALLRWEHPTRGLLPPSEFLSAVIDSDLDGPVTRWVLQTACADITRVAQATGRRPFVSVNLSPRQLGRPDLADEVANALALAGLSPRQLWLEITEEHLVDKRHRPMLEQLHTMGCRIVLDDFGTGYSGLSYLQQLPVNVLKIDREFIARVGTDRVSSGITAAMADLADVLGIRVVAEGVETAEQAELLRGMGVALAQGYLFGRPEPIGDGPPSLTTRVLQRPRGVSSDGDQPPALTTVNDSMTTG